MSKITFKTPDGTMGGYLALPAKTPAPAILVIQEIFGVNQVMRDLCDAYAAQGYVAACPDLFWRIEPGIDITDRTKAEWDKAFALFGKFDVDQGVADLKTALAHLRGLPEVQGKVGTVGYCLGGKLAFLMATRSPADANVSFYGVQLDQYLGEAKDIGRPLLLHIAAKDQFVPPEAQEKVKAGLKGNPQVTIHVYEGQDHAFARVGGEHYDQGAADLANRRTADFFRQHLGGAGAAPAKAAKTGGKKAPAVKKPAVNKPGSVGAIRFEKTGGPEVLRWTTVELPEPGKGEVLVRHTAVGLNYIDTYHRSGLYPVPLPSGIGLEAAGVVEKVGKGVAGLKVGDRVAYGTGPIGAYSEARVMPAEKLVKIPKGVADETAAAMMLKGLTVQYLLRQTYRVSKGETVLVHAAAGGIGLIAGQWLKALGVTAIGTVGSEEKAKLARKHGYKHVINYNTEDVVARVRQITKGAMLPVVYDGVGKDTWERSLDCLAPLGMMVTFGNASGPVPPVNLGQLSAKGSLFVTRPTLMSYTRTPALLQAMAKDLFKVVVSGAVKIKIDQTYALKDAAQAHRDLEGRKTTGSTVLLP
jgi:NADPH2:quinone reductase